MKITSKDLVRLMRGERILVHISETQTATLEVDD